MIINKSSWHYRLLTSMDCNIPKSLCPYFWKTIFVSFMVCALSSIAAFVVSVCVYGWSLLVYAPNESIFQYLLNCSLYEHLRNVAVSIGITIGGAFTVVLCLYLLVSDVRELIHGSIYEKSPEISEILIIIINIFMKSAKIKSS